MRVGMGLIKNEHGVFHVRRKVPKALEVATARAMGVPRSASRGSRRRWAPRTRSRRKVLAKPVMMKFDRILAQAEALLVEHPVRTELTEAEIKRIADYFYAHELGADEELREEGIGSRSRFCRRPPSTCRKRVSSSKHRSTLPKRPARACRTA